MPDREDRQHRVVNELPSGLNVILKELDGPDPRLCYRMSYDHKVIGRKEADLMLTDLFITTFTIYSLNYCHGHRKN